ncbi:unnamed protein product [Aphanomyces euteiches]
MTLVETSTEKPTIELQVFGIREPGDDITVELCRVLEQKLDESLLNILMKAMPNMKASRSVSGSSRQNKLTTADFEFLLDEHLFSYFVKEKLVETPYIRLAPPIDPVDASDSIKLADNSLLEDSASTLSFVINVNPELSGRTLIAFTPQIFHVLLDNNNPPAVVSATLLRAIDGMGLAEYLRETGTPMEDIVTRPRVSSSTSEKVDQPTITMPPITPVGPTAPRPGVVNPPPMVSTRKAPVPPNATNALMAARARARGVVKAPPASTPSDDSSESKLPPAWSLTLNKDMLAPRTSLKVTPTAAATKTIAATKPSLPPRRQSNAEKIVAKGMSSKCDIII